MDKILDFLVSTSKSAYQKIKGFEKELSFKGKKDFLTNCDLEVERFFIEEIKKHYPKASIVSEEFNADVKKTKECFIVDPIDGTANFSSGSACWGIQSAYVQDGECLVACIYLPALDRLYTAIKGEGAFLNAEKITISKETKIENSIVSVGDMVLKHPEKVSQLVDKVARVRLFGAACYEFSEVARGATNGHLGFGSLSWDIEPGILLCLEAGAAVHRTDDIHIVACNENMLNCLKEIFNGI